MNKHNATEIEKQVVWETLSPFMDTTTSVFICDSDSIIAFCNSAMETLGTYENTPLRVPEMRKHALNVIARGFANLN
jgi:hypothetical protein